MLSEELALLEKLASSGPWRTTVLEQGVQIWSGKGSYVGEIRNYNGDDVELIVALRNNLPAIIAALKAQEATNATNP